MRVCPESQKLESHGNVWFIETYTVWFTLHLSQNKGEIVLSFPVRATAAMADWVWASSMTTHSSWGPETEAAGSGTPAVGTIMGFAFKEIMKELLVISAFLSDKTVLLFIISSYMHSQSNCGWYFSKTKQKYSISTIISQLKFPVGSDKWGNPIFAAGWRNRGHHSWHCVDVCDTASGKTTHWSKGILVWPGIPRPGFTSRSK